MVKYLILFILFIPCSASAEVIGVDTTLTFTPINFLSGDTVYVQAFNYFFTLPIYTGLVGFYIRMVIRAMRG